jgi:UDP-N-acetyl-D-mannosaminuronic acid dehydrogenase
MAFKADSDDARDSLSYKLRKVLSFESRAVFCSDPYIRNPAFVSTQELIDRCDIIVLATPHGEYRKLEIPDDKIVVDIWNFWDKGSRI